jgi:hypothetical protein
VASSSRARLSRASAPARAAAGRKSTTRLLSDDRSLSSSLSGRLAGRSDRPARPDNCSQPSSLTEILRPVRALGQPVPANNDVSSSPSPCVVPSASIPVQDWQTSFAGGRALSLAAYAHHLGWRRLRAQIAPSISAESVTVIRRRSRTPTRDHLAEYIQERPASD